MRIIAFGTQQSATRKGPYVWILNIFSLLLLAIGVIGLGLHNLGNRYFWTDESSTFYAALGWPSPGSPPAPISAAWHFTMNGFLDPGAFHMLVRVWAINIGTDPVALRLLPFIFFVAYVIGIVSLVRLLGAPLYVGSGVAGIMMLENISPYYSVELRPYSAGLAAAVLIPLLTLWLIRSPSFLRLSIFISGVVVFGSMQYNSMPVTWAAAAVLVFAISKRNSRNANTYQFIAAVFVVLWQPIFYFVSRGNPLTASGGNSLDYIPDLVLTAMPRDRLLEVVVANLFSPTALPRTVFLLLIPLLWWQRKIPRGLRTGDNWAQTLLYLWIAVVVATLATVFLALLGFIPWVLGTRWSIAEVGLIALSTAGLAAVVTHSALYKRRWFAALVAGAAVLATCLGTARLLVFERPNDVDVMSTFAKHILSGEPGATVVDVWSYPDVRYAMEFSGDHAQLLDQWVAHEISPTSRFDEANLEDIQTFLDSDSDRLLLRSESVLQELGVELPDDIEIIRFEPNDGDGEITIELPIILSKS